MNNKKDNMTLAGLRKEANLTQRELAHIIGVSTTTVAGWEAGRSTPMLKIPQVARMIAALPCTFTDLAELCAELEKDSSRGR